MTTPRSIHKKESAASGSGGGAALTEISFTLNGASVMVKAPPEETALAALRDRLDLTGTKEGCGIGECGACTIIVDGKAVNSCLMLAPQLEGRVVVTVEGLGAKDKLHPLQQAFLDEGAVQCGFCTPGMLLAAKALLDANPHPTREEIIDGIAGNLCRCTGYEQIVSAIEKVARDRSGKKGS